MNTKQTIKQQRNIDAVKIIIKKHKTHNTGKIQNYLLDEYNFLVTARSIRRYLITIKEESQVKVKVKKSRIAKKQKTPKVKQDGEITYPYLIKDPSGKEHRITGDNMTITIGWGESGQLITYDTIDKIWRYDHNGKVFDKNNKIIPYHKSRSNLSFEF